MASRKHLVTVLGLSLQVIGFIFAILVLNILFFSNARAAEGDLLWAKGGVSFNDPGEVRNIKDVVSAPDGGYYITGSFEGEENFNDSGISLTSSGGRDIFLAKYSADDTLVWAVSAGSGAYDSVEEMACSPNVCYIIGTIGDTAIFGSGAARTVVPIGNGRSFVAGFNTSNGDFTWVRQNKGNGDDIVMQRNIEVSEYGNAIVVGSFDGTIYIAYGMADRRSLFTEGFYDGFLAEFSPSGALLHIRQIGGAYSNDTISALASCNGMTYVVGSIGITERASVVYFGGGGDSLTVSNATAYVVQYSSGFTSNWIRYASGSTGSDGYARSLEAACSTDSGGSVVVLGDFTNGITFGRGGSVMTFLNAGRSSDMYIQKFDAGGNHIWIQNAGSSGTEYTAGIDISMADGDSVVVVGTYGGATIFSSGLSSVRLTSPIGHLHEFFAVKYSFDGHLDWIRSVGGPHNDHGNSVVVLSDGDILISGANGLSQYPLEWQNSLSGTTIVHTSTRENFFARYNSAGSLLWVEQIGLFPGHEGRGVALLSDNTTAVVGTFNRRAIFNMDSVDRVTLRAPGRAAFLAKYRVSGELLSARVLNRGGEAYGYGVKRLNDDSLLLVGDYEGNTVFGFDEANATELRSRGEKDIFVAKYNSDDTLAWVKSAGGDLDDKILSTDVLADGSLLIAGSFSGQMTFGNGADAVVINSMEMANDIFVAKYNSDGTLAWAKQVGGTAEDDHGAALSAFRDGSFILTGVYSGSVTFGFGEARQTTLSSVGGAEDVFVAKYNTDGALVWVKSAGDNQPEYSYGVAAMPDGSSVVTGRFIETMLLGAGEANQTLLTSVGDADIFVAKYNADGTLAWARKAGGAGADAGKSVSALTDGSFVVAGYYFQRAIFGEGAAAVTLQPFFLTNQDHAEDVFVAKYDSRGGLLWAKSGSSSYMNDTALAVTVNRQGEAAITGKFTNFSSADAPDGGQPFQVVFGAGEENETRFIFPTGSMFIVKLAGPPAYAIRGKVKDSRTGVPIPGVLVRLTGGVDEEVITDSMGDYSFKNLLRGAYEVFAPDTVDYIYRKESAVGAKYRYNDLAGNQENQNFLGTPRTYVVSGRVSVGTSMLGTSLPAVRVRLTGDDNREVLTDSNGRYMFGNLTSGNYTVRVPAQMGYTFAAVAGGAGYNYSPLSEHKGGQDFRATAVVSVLRYSIGGRITFTGSLGISVPLSNLRVRLWFMDQGEKTNPNAWIYTYTDVNGSYKFSNLAADGNYAISPSPQPYRRYEPASREYLRLGADQTAQNFTALSQLSP